MLIDERQNEILKIVNEKKYVSVEELIKLIYASPATIRRDLYNLEMLSLVKRVRGGASSIDNKTGEISSLIRQQSNAQEKKKIANVASNFLTSDKSYFFDSSTTASYLVPFFKKLKNCLVITNGFETASMLNAIPGVKTFFIGGELQNSVGATVGGFATETIEKFYCDVCFFSCHGFSEFGPMEGSLEQQKCKETMIKNSKLSILLVDSSKFNKKYMIRTCNLEMIDVIISDVELPPEMRKVFEKYGIQLLTA